MINILHVVGAFILAGVILYVQEKILKLICAPRSFVFWRRESLNGCFYFLYLLAALFVKPADIGVIIVWWLILFPIPLSFYYYLNESGLTCQRFLFRKFYSWDQLDRVKLDAFISQRYGSELEYILVFKNGFEIKVLDHFNNPKGLRIIHHILFQRGVKFEHSYGNSFGKLPPNDQLFLKNLDRIDEEGNIAPTPPKPLPKGLSAMIKRQLLPGEKIILTEPVHYLTASEYHHNFVFVITDQKLILICRGNKKYSFAIPIADVKMAKAIAKKSGEYVIELNKDCKYHFNTSGDENTAKAQRKKILHQLKNLSINVID